MHGPGSFRSSTRRDALRLEATMDPDIVPSLRKAVKDCSDRGLYFASKWCASYIYLLTRTHSSQGPQNYCCPSQPIAARPKRNGHKARRRKKPQKLSWKRRSRTSSLVRVRWVRRRSTCARPRCCTSARARADGLCGGISISWCVQHIIPSYN